LYIIWKEKKKGMWVKGKKQSATSGVEMNDVVKEIEMGRQSGLLNARVLDGSFLSLSLSLSLL